MIAEQRQRSPCERGEAYLALKPSSITSLTLIENAVEMGADGENWAGNDWKMTTEEEIRAQFMGLEEDGVIRELDVQAFDDFLREEAGEPTIGR